MSKQTEALKLALEVLEGERVFTLRPDHEGKELTPAKVTNAITAIRKALAEQPAQQQQCMEHGECFGGECIYPAPQPAPVAKPHEQQEPVAWRNAALRVGEDLCSVGPFGYYDMTAEQWLDWALSVVTVHAPPASKPWVGLTDAQIGAVAADIWGSVLIAPQSYQAFARAIEAAHGIK